MCVCKCEYINMSIVYLDVRDFELRAPFGAPIVNCFATLVSSFTKRIGYLGVGRSWLSLIWNVEEEELHSCHSGELHVIFAMSFIVYKLLYMSNMIVHLNLIQIQ